MSEPAAQPLLVPLPQQHQPTATQERRIAAAVATVAPHADLHPDVTIIANLLLDRVEYMSARGLHLLETTQEAIRALGPGYWSEYFNPADAEDYLPKVFEMIQSPDLWAVTSVFQQVRVGPGRRYLWYLSATRVLLRDEDTGQPLLLLTNSIPVDPLHHVTHKVRWLLAENLSAPAHRPLRPAHPARARGAAPADLRPLGPGNCRATLYLGPNGGNAPPQRAAQPGGGHGV